MNGLYRLALSDKLLQLCRGLGIQCPSFRNTSIRVDIPGENQFLQPLHQDVREMPSENCLNFWIPLQDVSPDTGTLRVYARSHSLGPLIAGGLTEHGYQRIADSRLKGFDRIECTLSIGDVLVFHPYLVHGSLPGSAQHIRWTAITRFDDALEMPWMIQGENPYKTVNIQ